MNSKTKTAKTENKYFVRMSPGEAIYGGGWTAAEADADAISNCGRLKGELYAVSESIGDMIEERGDEVLAEVTTAVL